MTTSLFTSFLQMNVKSAATANIIYHQYTQVVKMQNFFMGRHFGCRHFGEEHLWVLMLLVEENCLPAKYFLHYVHCFVYVLLSNSHTEHTNTYNTKDHFGVQPDLQFIKTRNYTTTESTRQSEMANTVVNGTSSYSTDILVPKYGLQFLFLTKLFLTLAYIYICNKYFRTLQINTEAYRSNALIYNTNITNA